MLRKHFVKWEQIHELHIVHQREKSAAENELSELQNQLEINQPKICLFEVYSDGKRCKYSAPLFPLIFVHSDRITHTER